MEKRQSSLLSMQRAEGQIKALLRVIDTDLLDQNEKKATTSLRRLVVDARLDVRDYEFSETRIEQVAHAKQAKSRLAKLRSVILAAGSAFSPSDVAQVTAELEQIEGQLQ